jgi:hypothetical protein
MQTVKITYHVPAGLFEADGWGDVTVTDTDLPNGALEVVEIMQYDEQRGYFLVNGERTRTEHVLTDFTVRLEVIRRR